MAMTATERFRGWPVGIAHDRALAALLGLQDHKTVNTEDSVGVWTQAWVDIDDDWQNCRAISVDTDGIVKFDYKTDGEGATRTCVRYLNKGTIHQQRNVTRVYKHYKSATECTGKVFEDDTGESVIGLKLHR